MLELAPSLRAVVESSVVVTGSARSGTTIAGKLIHTFQNVEYVFEPPVVNALFSVIDVVPNTTWKLLYEAYLAEEFLINALAGRSINTNRADDSSIYAVKTEAEVDDRLSHSLRKVDAMERVRGATVAYKLPDIVPFIPQLLALFPLTRIVLMTRGAVETIHSLMAKSWFKDEGEQAETFWPFRQIGATRVPYWVPNEDQQLWCDLSELDRCAYYYLLMSNAPPEGEKVMHLRYAELVSRPAATVARLTNWLGVQEGPRTREVLSSIGPMGKAVDDGILEKISEQFRGEVLRQSGLQS